MFYHFKKFFITILFIIIVNLFAESRLKCDISKSDYFGFRDSYEGIVVFYTGEELNRREWFKIWEEKRNEKNIYAVFEINDETYIVETDMRFSANIFQNFNDKYFENIMINKTEGIDQNNRNWQISWRFINPSSKKFRKSVF